MWLRIALVALAPLVIVVMLIRKVAKKYTPWALVWWSVGLAGSAVAGISGANSTMPSTAPRLTVSGLAQGCAQQTIGRGNCIYSFLLMRTNAPSISLSTHIELPICWSGPSTDSDGRLYRVKYLADPSRTLKNEAISIEVLAGPNSGWQSSVDARPFGLWLGIPTGLALILVRGIGAVRNRKADSDLSATTSSTGEPLLKDTDSDMIELKL
jgi:hypothetical protein